MPRRAASCRASIFGEKTHLTRSTKFFSSSCGHVLSQLSNAFCAFWRPWSACSATSKPTSSAFATCVSSDALSRAHA